MLQKFCLCCALFLLSVVESKPQNSDKILSYINQPYQEVNGVGSYKYQFETSNGIFKEEQGRIEKTPTGSTKTVSGSYSYTGDNGKLYSVNYVSDENGYRAQVSIGTEKRPSTGTLTPTGSIPSKHPLPPKQIRPYPPVPTPKPPLFTIVTPRPTTPPQQYLPPAQIGGKLCDSLICPY